MANDEMSIFDLGVNDIESYNEEKKESILYRPSADQGKDGIYRSLIRFIPNPSNPKKSVVRKFVYWLKDDSGNGMYVDAPSTIGEKDPVQDQFFKLRNSESAVDKKMSGDLKRREIFYSIVQIIKDPHNSDLEGKLKIFKYGQKIKEKIDSELNPPFDEPTQIFDLFAGKNFELTISKQNNFNNYDSSKFSSKQSIITINDEEVTKNEDGRTLILSYIKDAPNLDTFDFKPWDDEVRGKVNNILNRYRSPGESINTVTNQSVDTEITDIKTSTDSFNAGEPVKKETIKQPIKEDVPVAAESDDLDSFLSDLDL
jgi:hypothetical protein